jgi:nucleoside-diphosphate-sugar epimerase
MDEDRRLTVAVTGASGYIASRLVEVLCADERVDRVLGFDLRPPSFHAGKFIFDTMDVRNPQLKQRLEGVDAVVHLAFIMNPIKDESFMRDVNVNGSHNVFTCARDAGVSKIVYVSSATVYGAHPDNDVPLTEESPLRANLDFSYPAHKLEVEYIAKEFREEFAEGTFTILRPAIVYGSHVDNAWSHFLQFPVIFGVKGHDPPFQFVHEDDVARALAFSIHNDLDGAYNLAPRGWLEADEALEIIGRRRWQQSEPAAFALIDRLWAMGLVEAPAGMLHYVMHPWVVSAEKLARAGFLCEKSNAATLAEALEHVRGHLRLGRATLRRSDVVKGAAAGAGVAAAITLYGTARRRAAAHP